MSKTNLKKKSSPPSKLLGIGATSRQRLSVLSRNLKGTITPKDAAKILEVDPVAATKMLARWAKNGWLSRIKQGLYIPLPLQAEKNDVPPENPWAVIEAMFGRSYIGGWSAAEYWGLTEQVFNSTMVFCLKQSKKLEVDANGAKFLLKTVSEKRFFGTKSVWIGPIKVLVSDPSKTIVDALNAPSVVGGLRMLIEIFKNYMRSEHKNLEQVKEYASKMGNSAICKRLGFLLERDFPEEKSTIEALKKMIKTGTSQLDPDIEGDHLVTRWGLWVPFSLKSKCNIYR